MKITVKNTEYWEWDVPQHLIDVMKDECLCKQELVDRYFKTTSTNTKEIAYPYYEVKRISK